MHRPSGFGPAALLTAPSLDAPAVRLAFVDARGREVDPQDVVLVREPGALPLDAGVAAL